MTVKKTTKDPQRTMTKTVKKVKPLNSCYYLQVIWEKNFIICLIHPTDEEMPVNYGLPFVPPDEELEEAARQGGRRAQGEGKEEGELEGGWGSRKKHYEEDEIEDDQMGTVLLSVSSVFFFFFLDMHITSVRLRTVQPRRRRPRHGGCRRRSWPG